MKDIPVVYLLARAPSAYDSRLLRQAKFLAWKGYRVTIIATRYADLPDREERDGYVIERVPVEPPHYRLLRLFRMASCRRLARRSNRLAYGLARMILRVFGLWREAGKDVVTTATMATSLPASHERPNSGGRISGKPIIVSGWSRIWTAMVVKIILAGPVIVAGLAGVAFVAQLLFLVVLRAGALAFSWSDYLYSLIRTLLLSWLFDRPLRLLDFTWRSYRIAKKTGADVIQAKDLPALPAAYVVAWLTGAKLIYDSSELNLESGSSAMMSGASKWILRRYERFLARRSDSVIVVNESIGKSLARSCGISMPFIVRNCPESSSVLRDNTILRDKFGLEWGGQLLLYHGGFSSNRGLHQLVDSMVYLSEAALVLMGYGPLKGSLQDQIRELGVGHRVVIIGAVPVDELINVIASADVGVMPIQGATQSYYLSLPNKLFECLMAGVPVAASNLPEMARIIREHQVGEVFNPEDPKDIARAVTAILDADDYQGMRSRARELALSTYNWEQEANQFEAAYNVALDREARVG